MFKQLDYSSEENIRKDVGEYNNHFTRPSDNDDVIFTQPYIGSQGLGIQAVLVDIRFRCIVFLVFTFSEQDV